MTSDVAIRMSVTDAHGAAQRAAGRVDSHLDAVTELERQMNGLPENLIVLQRELAEFKERFASVSTDDTLSDADRVALRRQVREKIAGVESAIDATEFQERDLRRQVREMRGQLVELREQAGKARREYDQLLADPAVAHTIAAAQRHAAKQESAR